MDLTLIKQRISCLDYASRIGMQLQKGRTTSLEGGTNKTALLIEKDNWYDFKAQIGGDVIDLCAVKEFDGDRGQAIRRLAEITGVEADNQNWVRYTQNLNNQIQKWHESLRQEDIDYLHSRGITDETIKALKIGYNGRLVIPYWKNGYVCYYISRGDKPKYLKAKLDGLNENTPWGVNTLDRKSECLVIAEGAFDALSYYQEGSAVLATMGGHFTQEQMKSVITYAKSFPYVLLTFDNDEAGDSFTHRMEAELFSHRIPFKCAKIPYPYKDVSAYYQTTHSVELEKIDGLEHFVKSFKGEDDFEDFVYKAARYVDIPTMTKLFKLAKPNFEEDWINAVKKTALSAPSEDTIAKQVIKNHTLKNHPKIGFYEYNTNRWERQSDDQIKSYIAYELGRYRAGSKCNSILSLIKAATVDEGLYNKQNVMNFINGTLELDTLTFREHRPEDMCTCCLPYPYKDGVYHQPWHDFVLDIMDGDETKATLLQEAAGYVMYTTNELQKAFVLIGSGANGKSVFLKVLMELYGMDNVSTIEMSAFARDFQTIHLMNSLLNISSETKSDVSGAESVFKQITAGDAINSCYKGKDIITFVPRSKLFIACNEYMRSKDTTEGYLRRLCFIHFPLHYVDYPKEPNDRQIIPNIEQKFLPYMTGIFNWALDGYRMLKQADKFTDTNEQTGIIDEYKEVINPLISFVKEFTLPAPTFALSNEELYKDYRIWCEECGHKPKSRQSFLKAVAPLIKQYRKDVEGGVWKSSGCTIRGYKKAELHMVTHELQMGF